MFTVKTFHGLQDEPMRMQCFQAQRFFVATSEKDVEFKYIDAAGQDWSMSIIGIRARRLIVENDTGKTITNISVARLPSKIASTDCDYEEVHVTLPDGSNWVGDVEILPLPEPE